MSNNYDSYLTETEYEYERREYSERIQRADKLRAELTIWKYIDLQFSRMPTIADARLWGYRLGNQGVSVQGFVINEGMSTKEVAEYIEITSTDAKRLAQHLRFRAMTPGAHYIWDWIKWFSMWNAQSYRSAYDHMYD